MPFYTTEECATYISDLIWANRATLTPAGGDEIAGVYPAEQRIVPKYPAVMVVPGPIGRQLVQTGMQVELVLRVFIYLMHAKLTKTRTRRTQEDLQLGRNVVNLLHNDFKLGGNVVTSLVEAEDPGSLAGPQGLAVVGNRLTWRGQQREHIWPT